MTSAKEIERLRNDVNTLVIFVEKISERLMEITKDLKTKELRHYDFVFDMEYQIDLPPEF